MEDINLLNKRDVVTLSTSGGAIVDWSIIGAPARPALSLRRSRPRGPPHAGTLRAAPSVPALPCAR